MSSPKVNNRLYAVSPSRGNIVISPLTTSAGLQILLKGARGQTAESIRRTLFLPTEYSARSTPEILLASLGVGAAADKQARIAESLWVQDGFQVLDEFAASANTQLAAEVHHTDLAGSPHLAARQINQWALIATGGAIGDIVPPAVLDPETRLVVVSALSFSGTWAAEFDPSASMACRFQARDGTEWHLDSPQNFATEALAADDSRNG